MTSEFLLEAMGLIDDELIRDADEARPAPKVVSWRRWGAWAACLALALTLGYGVTRLGMGGGFGGASDSSHPSAAGSSEAAGTGASIAAGAASTDGTGADAGSIYLEIQGVPPVYALTGGMVDELPGDSSPLGPLSALYPGAPSPSTDAEDYVGCELYMAPDGTLYVQHPQGGFAVAESVQP